MTAPDITPRLLFVAGFCRRPSCQAPFVAPVDPRHHEDSHKFCSQRCGKRHSQRESRRRKSQDAAQAAAEQRKAEAVQRFGVAWTLVLSGNHRWAVWGQCAGKERFEDPRQAEGAARWWRSRPDVSLVAVYQCEFCDHWHLAGKDLSPGQVARRRRLVSEARAILRSVGEMDLVLAALHRDAFQRELMTGRGGAELPGMRTGCCSRRCSGRWCTGGGCPCTWYGPGSSGCGTGR